MQLSEHPTTPTGRIGLALATLMRAAARARAQDTAAGGDFHAMGLLHVLDETGPLRSNLLAEAVYADPSTVSRQVAVLVERGLVSREPDPQDGRAALLALTDAGRRVLADKMRRRDAYLDGLTSTWSDHDREVFADLFHRFATGFATSAAELFAQDQTTRTHDARATDHSQSRTATETS